MMPGTVVYMLTYWKGLLGCNVYYKIWAAIPVFLKAHLGILVQ